MERGANPPRSTASPWPTGFANERFDSPSLRWYINYACRDDYGALAKDTSAWAGIHYFASRDPEEKGPLTWPEGNGWIAQHLIKKLSRYIRTGSVYVYRVRRAPACAHRTDRIHRRTGDLRRSHVPGANTSSKVRHAPRASNIPRGSPRI